MRHKLTILSVVIVAGVLAAGFFTRSAWFPWAATDGDKDALAHVPVGNAPPTQQVRLSAQAQANLHLNTQPLEVGTYWRTIQVPGMIVDRPAQSDRGVVAPATGVVVKVHRFPGDSVKPGEILFTLRLLSEAMLLAQTELFKATQEQQLVHEKKKRLTNVPAIVPEATIIELDNQLRRLTVAQHAHRQELLTRGLTVEQIDRITQGKYVTEIEIKAPRQIADKNPHGSSLGKVTADPSFEVQELRVELGQQVQAGQTLSLISNHQTLYIEGRAFRQETPLLEKALKEGWPVQVEFMEDDAHGWPALEQSFAIRHIANTIDPVSRTFAFYMPLNNQSRSLHKEEGTQMLWRFRPGQKVRLHVRVEKIDNVFVLPADAVVREGPDAFVFRQNGDIFDRKPVQVIFQDRQHVVIANDGSVPRGIYIAQNAAAQINRVLRSGSSAVPPGFHMHADGSMHSNAEH